MRHEEAWADADPPLRTSQASAICVFRRFRWRSRELIAKGRGIYVCRPDLRAPILATMEFPSAYLEPHTREWLDALEAGDPAQAASTRALITAIGRRDICSICGGASVRDYWVISRKTDPSPVPTLRLCADCLPIREAIYEQRLVLLRRSDVELSGRS